MQASLENTRRLKKKVHKGISFLFYFFSSDASLPVVGEACPWQKLGSRPASTSFASRMRPMHLAKGRAVERKSVSTLLDEKEREREETYRYRYSGLYSRFGLHLGLHSFGSSPILSIASPCRDADGALPRVIFGNVSPRSRKYCAARFEATSAMGRLNRQLWERSRKEENKTYYTIVGTPEKRNKYTKTAR